MCQIGCGSQFLHSTAKCDNIDCCSCALVIQINLDCVRSCVAVVCPICESLRKTSKSHCVAVTNI